MASRWSRPVRAVLGLLLVALMVWLWPTVVRPGGTPREPTPSGTSSSPGSQAPGSQAPASRAPASRAPRADDIGTLWRVTPDQLRPDQPGARFQHSPDGLLETHYLIDAGTTWAGLTSTGSLEGIVVHGLDPETGAQRWSRPLEKGHCAATALRGQLVCAEAIDEDRATGLGTAWNLLLLDAATGQTRRQARVDAWLTALVVRDEHILVLEQRLPAPHAVIQGLDADLTHRFTLDLVAESEHDRLFSDNRVSSRMLPLPDGPALDRPRVRSVADGLTAFWIGDATAFVNVRAGRLVGLARCSRLVDDGERLWCNAGPRTITYSYALEPLFETDLDVRLAFPDRDPRAGDRTDPVFLDASGRAVRVEPRTGRTLGPLADTSLGSAFGMVTHPGAHFVDGLTLLRSEGRLIAVDAITGEHFWEQQHRIDDAFAWGEHLLLTGHEVTVVDRTSGATIARHRQPHGLYTELFGQVVTGVGPDEVARLVDP